MRPVAQRALPVAFPVCRRPGGKQRGAVVGVEGQDAVDGLNEGGRRGALCGSQHAARIRRERADIVGAKPGKLGKRVALLFRLAQHAVGAREPRPPLRVVGLLPEPEGKLRDHAADHLRPLFGRHKLRRRDILASRAAWRLRRGSGIDPGRAAGRQARDPPAQHRQPLGIVGRGRFQRPPAHERCLGIPLLQRRETEIEARPRLPGIDLERGGEGPFRLARDRPSAGRGERLAVERSEIGVGRQQRRRAAIGAGGLGIAPERGQGPPQQAPAAGVVGPLLHPLGEPLDQRRHVGVALGRGGVGERRLRGRQHGGAAGYGLAGE